MPTGKRIWIAAFYWIGVATTLACFAFVLAGNTAFVWRFEHTGWPMSWAFGVIAILAFLGAELSQSAFSLPRKVEDRSAQLSPELAAAESES